MSVLIVSDATYQKVANSLFMPGDSGYLRIRCFIESYAEQKYWPTRWQAIEDEIEKLRKANYLSFEQRYKTSVSYIPLVYSGSRERCQNLPELLKALECIEYQIELNDFDFTFVRGLIEVIKDTIIENLPEYQNAYWG